ncbi:MAG: epoxyqueuosine reductase QueH [Clostridia bacterium]|nr:epoxyqueuosine reductase QueH [Clostridia bacterium]
MKTNYKILMDKEIEYIKTLGKKPKLLLHACCAPCSSAVLESLAQVFDITLFFYNPNISPEEEFVFRLEELKRLVPEMGLSADVISPPYNNSEFEDIAKGLESLPEGGERCRRCYALRLDKSVSFAKENGFDYVTTTLSISPYKNAQWLNEIGQEMGEKYGIKYLVSDFKKADGYKRSCALSEKYNLYRQNYCGCKYSKGAGNND